jgi:hypothetical protein
MLHKEIKTFFDARARAGVSVEFVAQTGIVLL